MFSNVKTYYIKTNGAFNSPLWHNLMKCAAMIDKPSFSHELTTFSPPFTISIPRVQVVVTVVWLYP